MQLETFLDGAAFPNAAGGVDGKISEPEHDLSILAETPQVLKETLELIASEDPKHYQEMVKLISPATGIAILVASNTASVITSPNQLGTSSANTAED